MLDIKVQFSSVNQSCLTLCDTVDCSMPGFPVHQQLPELAQSDVHRVGDSIQLYLLLSSTSPPAFNLSQHQGQFFALDGQSIGNHIETILEIKIETIWFEVLQWIFRTDFLLDWLVWSLCSPRDSQESSPTPQLKSINYLVLSFLYGSTLTSIHDNWKNHSFDYTDLCHQSYDI